MSDSRLPVEVELVYDVMPCNALRVAQEPIATPHACSYFRKWGTYHSYDYVLDGPPPSPGIVQEAEYVGRAPLLPEILSGCRKAPIMAVGINPNLPGWWRHRRRSLYPLFDDYKQYAHYFRYRNVAKLELSEVDYAAFGGGDGDDPFSDFELDVPTDADGRRRVRLELQPVAMYEAYQSLLDALAEEMGWSGHRLTVGEDVSYGNMVACPSAKWTTRPATSDPLLPPMTSEERREIVTECFRERSYFLRQLFQSLPSIILVFSNSTARALIGELQERFVQGDPRPDESIQDLMQREIRLAYGDLPDGSTLEARVIFAPHITGDPDNFRPARARVVEQLVEEARFGALRLSPVTGHLLRSRGACVLCPMLELGPCDYEQELEPLSNAPALTADSSTRDLLAEKRVQEGLLATIPTAEAAVPDVWDGVEEADDDHTRELDA